MENESSSNSGRSRREKKDKTRRFAAIQKLKELKATGSKHKYEVGEVDNVYDVVDEKEYNKTIIERQQSDWIVDDGGGDGGYVEDGREIFDDDMDPESIQKNSKETKNKLSGGVKKRKRVEEKTTTTTKGNNNIIDMLQGMPRKKKCDEKSLVNADDIMASMLKQLEEEKLNEKKLKPIVKNKFSVADKSSPKQQPNLQKPQPVNIDNDEIENATIFDSPSSPKMKKEIKPKKIFQQESPQQQQQHCVNKMTEKTLEEKKIIKNSEEEKNDLIEDFPADGDFNIEKTDPAVKSIPVVVAEAKMNLDNIESEEDEFSEILFSIDDNDSWKAIGDKNNTPASSTESTSQTKISVPIVKNKNNDDIVRFYWLDATEDPYSQPGVVNLFGKVYHEPSDTYVSCYVSVKNIPRRIYCLPRDMKINDDGSKVANSMKDVYDEWNDLANLKKIKQHRSQTVNKFYAFDREGTPVQSDYLEVHYSSLFPPVNSNYQGKSIEHIFGTSSNALEIFLIERKIMGPCWLEIKQPIPVEYPATWSKLQVDCLNMKNISVSEKPENPSEKENKQFTIPPVSIMILNIRTTLNIINQNNQVAMIGILNNGNYPIDKPPIKPCFEQKCFVTRPKDITWPLYARDTLTKYKDTNIIVCETEFDLFESFLNYLQEIDADFLIGYDCGFQFDVLIRRLTELNVKYRMKTSKLKRRFTPFYKGKVNMARAFWGRAICDVQVAAKEVNVKVRSYDLDTICSAVLETKPNTIANIKPIDCSDYYQQVDKLIDLIKITMKEAKYMLLLICKMNIIPLALQITCIAGNVISRTLCAGRAERNEYLLLHAFSKQGYIIPDRKVQVKKSEQESTKKKAAFVGGLVLDPKKGFYDEIILLMDFNSLYPSIIQEFNLCFTTIHGVCFRELDASDIPDENVKFGVIPTQIRQLVQRRIGVKNELKNLNLSSEKKMELNIRQLAYKLTANSMYGCLGASHSRFYAKNLAALVTLKGREILQNTKSLVEKLNYQVIYGDTDSIMINSKIINYDDAFKIATKIKSEVNKLYKGIELGIDGLFKFMLLLNKKKYAAVTITKLSNGQFDYKTEIKGLDIVRRDWCQLASETGKQIINKIFVDAPIEEKVSNIRILLENIAIDVKKLVDNARNEKASPLASLVITKQLSKNPKDYPDKRQPHVAIAQRLNMAGGRMWKAGDIVPYIICLDNTMKTPMERAYHIDEYKKNVDLQIDMDYYLRLQIIPVIERITLPLPELNGSFLAECLGITDYKSKNTSTAFYNNNNNNDDDDEDSNANVDDEKRFENCEPFTFRCRNLKCYSLNEVNGFFLNKTDETKTPTMLACINKDCNLPPWKYTNTIQNELKIAMNKKIEKYYQQDIICDNPSCIIPAKTFRPYNSLPTCIKCSKPGIKRAYSETDLQNQFDFYEHIFTLNNDSTNLTLNSNEDTNQSKAKYPMQMLTACHLLKNFVNEFSKNSDRHYINFTELLPLTNKKTWDPVKTAEIFAEQNQEERFKESQEILNRLAAISKASSMI